MARRADIPRSGTRSLAALVLCGALVGASAAQAQSDDDVELDVSVNYVYAAQLGFGGYRVGGLSVNVYSLPVEFTLRDVLLDWRLRVALPVLYGDYEFKKTVQFRGEPVRIRADQKTLSAEPKLKLEIPILEPWTVSLIAAWGVGSTFDTEVTARINEGQRSRVPEAERDLWFYTYQAGVSSLLQHFVDRWTLSLGNAFIYAGTASFESDENVEAYGALETGVEARHPLGFDIERYEPDASVYFIWYYFTPSLEFSRVERDSLRVDNLYEIGITVGADRATPFQLPILGNPRIGVSYRVGNDLDAVRVNFGFPF